MSAFDFFSRGRRKEEVRRERGLNSAQKDSDLLPSTDPTALALRHHQERTQQLLWDEADDAPNESEDWTDLFERQSTEIAAAIATSCAHDAKAFRDTYSGTLKKLTDDAIAVRKQALREEHARMQAQKATGDEFGPEQDYDDVDGQVSERSFVPSCLKETSPWDSSVKPVQFLAGDLGRGKGYLMASGGVCIPWRRQMFELKDIVKLEVATEDSATRIGGMVGWGAVGATLLGPAGLVVGGILGAKGKDVTFVVMLRDGKRFLASARSSIYEKILAGAFR